MSYESRGSGDVVGGPTRRGPNSGFAKQPAYFRNTVVNQTMFLKTNGTGAFGKITIVVLPPSLDMALPSAVEMYAVPAENTPPPPPAYR